MLLTALLLPVLPVVFLLAVILLVSAQTLNGHLLGGAFALLAPSILLAPFALARSLPFAARRVIIPLVGAGLYVAAARQVPPDPLPFSVRSGLQSVWLTPRGLSRAHLAVVTPELDQGVLATWVVPPLDPAMDQREAGALRQAMEEVYGELAPEWQLPSVQGLAYRELLGGGANDRHLYVDLPPGEGPFPALVFLHGFGGNLQGYLWTLRAAAHAQGYAVVAPSYGAGLWFNDPEGEVVRRTLAWMASTGIFRMDRLALAALSNGGYGLGPAALGSGGRFRGIAWLSAVPDPAPLDRMASLGVPLLFLHGGVEDRIPIEETNAAVARMRRAGAEVDYDVVPDADHFLFFTHRSRVQAAITRWLSRVDAEPGGSP